MATKEISRDPHPIHATQNVAEQVKRLKALVKAKPETSRIVDFTPELAEYILSTANTSNRPMKPGKIREYAEALRKGRWGLTGDTVKFGPDGMLRDGQNRLAAAVRAKMPLITHTVFGVDPDLFPRMDIGKNRTPADVFHIAGLQYANHAAAAVRWLLILTGDNPKNRAAHYTNEQLLDAYRERFDPMEIENSVRVALDVKKGTGAPVGAVAALHYLFAQRDRPKANAFMRDWAEGKGKPRSATNALQKRLLDLAIATNRRVHETVRNALVIRAFNAYRKGKTLTKAELDFDPTEDTFPEIE